MSRETGSGKTPQRVVDKLNEKLSETSLNAMSRTTGVGISALHRYQKGIGEPTTATLQKLADYFGVSVAWLRGEEEELSNWEIENMWLRMMETEFIILKTLTPREETILRTAGKIEELCLEVNLNEVLTHARNILNLSEDEAKKLDDSYLKTVQAHAKSVMEKYSDYALHNF